MSPSDCVQTYTYEIVFEGTNTTPDFASIGEDWFVIETLDEASIGKFDLELLITPDGPSTISTPLVVPYTLQITGCIYDTIEVGQPIGNVIY